MTAPAELDFEELFSLLFPEERADLDFGLYRLLNARRESLRRFFRDDLPATLAELSRRASADDDLENELSLLQKKADDLGISCDQIPRYVQLQAEIAQSGSAVLAREAMRHLRAFVRMHYVDGDFIPLRRYRSDAYMIPYDGSETSFVYVNQDQYFTKSDQTFDTFRVRLGDGRRVTCTVTYAEERLGNAEDNTKQKRRYKLHSLEIDDEEVTLGFAFVPSEKATQDELTADAVRTVQEKTAHTIWFTELFREEASKPWIAGLIERFTKNAERDYFVHQDLGRFLADELDHYVFMEVLPRASVRDDATLRTASRVEAVLKGVADPLIKLLAQFENLQRDLWTKRRLVTETAYCLTLDKLPKELVATALANEAQRAEWAELYGVSASAAVSPQTHGGLFIDTRHFDRNFLGGVEASLAPLDGALDGLVIVSENTAALRTYTKCLAAAVDAVYIDPPFNTGSGSAFRYKNGYRHSSWCCLMEDAIALGARLLTDDGIMAMAIDDVEVSRLQMLADRVLGESRRLGTQIFVTKHGGRSNDRFLATSHEYVLYYASAAGSAEISFTPLTDEQKALYKFEDADGSKYKWRDFMRTGGLSFPWERPHSHYRVLWHQEEGAVVVFADPDKSVMEKPRGRRDLQAFLALPGASERDDLGEDVAYVFYPGGRELPSMDQFVSIEPIDTSGTTRVWRKTRLPFMIHVAKGQIQFDDEDGQIKIDIKDYEKRGTRPNSVANEKTFNATAYGTKLLKNMFGKSRVFSYPKALGTVKKALEQMVGDDEEAVVCDYFAGSGTTGHAVIDMNRDGGSRRYVLVEMAEYVDEVTIPRLKKAAYSSAWVGGKPTETDALPHVFKIIKLESYEDTLENVPVAAVPEREEILELFPDFRRSFVPASLLRKDVTESSAYLPSALLAQGNVEISVLDHNGKRRCVVVDLSETLSVWLGLAVESRHRGDHIDVTIGWQHETCVALVIRRLAAGDSFAIAREVKRCLGDRNASIIVVNGDVSVEAFRREGVTGEIVTVEETLFADS